VGSQAGDQRTIGQSSAGIFATQQLVTALHSLVGSTGPKMNPPVADRGRLFRRCALWLAWFAAALAIALVATRTVGMWADYREQVARLDRVQQRQIEVAAARIALFVKEIEAQMGWLTQLPSDAVGLDEWHVESVRVLRQVPAITELARIDAAGRRQVRVSRLALDVVGGQTDISRDPEFMQAMATKRYYSPVYFRRGSEPYMTLAIAGPRKEYGVVSAEVNLKFIWGVISEVTAALQGTAFIVDPGGRLIAHPDMSLVLRNTDLSQLSCEEKPLRGGIQHSQPSMMYASVPSLGWTLVLCGQGAASKTFWRLTRALQVNRI
jgi:two-component system NtrC family sensor kinase